MKPRRWLRGCQNDCLTLLVIAGLWFLLFVKQLTNVRRWDQPPTVNYQSYDPYSVVIQEISPVLSFSRHYRVFVVKTADLNYGHGTDYEFHDYHREPDYFDRCTVDWTPEGVTLTEPTGHRLFIPKKAFIGGR